MVASELIELLGDALTDAGGHLEYCGYGDSWERECAQERGLEDKITLALEQYELWLGGSK